MKKVPFILAMGVTICVSNILVQHLLGSFLTWAAFTYPIAFLIIDLANRIYGKEHAKTVLWWGFTFGVGCSLIAWGADKTTLRVAIGSGLAFVIAQFTDIYVFDRLRKLSWWKTPMISSVVGSIIDTTVFFSIAFSEATFRLVENSAFSDQNAWAFEVVPIPGFGTLQPLWVSLAIADFCIKVLMVIMLLAPYNYVLNHTMRKNALV